MTGLPPKRWQLFSGKWLAVPRWLWLVVGAPLILGLLGNWIWAQWPSWVGVEKVTVLIPVQGGVKPGPYNPKEPYEQKISNDIATTIENARLEFEVRNADVDRTRFEFLHYVEGTDADERRRIAREQVQRAAAAGRPVVCVIGHTTSQATLDAAPVYAEFKIPVLMPYATKTGIAEDVARLRVDGCSIPRALAFPPPNKTQAESLARFLRHHKIRSVIVFRDATNRAYSDDCANELVRLLEVDVPADAQPIEVIGDVAVGGTSGQWYVTDAVKAANADAYVVVAMTKPSLEIVRQVTRSAATPKFILLTDGAIDENLIPRIAGSITATTKRTRANGAARLPESVDETTLSGPPVYISFPESEVRPLGYDKIFARDKERSIKGLSHSAYLADAVFLAYGVAAGALRNGATSRRVRAIYVRELDRVMNRSDAGGSILGAFSANGERIYKFDTSGSRTAGTEYTIYRIDPTTAGNETSQGYVKFKYEPL